MLIKRIKFLIGVWGILWSVNSYAWWEIGHLAVADIAYGHLTKPVRQKVDKMVADLNKEYPEIKNFVVTAPWADAIRKQKIELYTHWHYINEPVISDDTPVKKISDSDNAVWALNHMKAILANPAANPYEKARILAFLVHVVGDLHQPLHTVGRISREHPNGDEGGNLYWIRNPHNNAPIRLHTVWDNAFGSLTGSTTLPNVKKIAKDIEAKYPLKYFAEEAKNITPENWVKEGVNLSTTFVYSTPENQLPSKAYVEKTQQIAEQRIALGGYRLAALLNEWLSN